MSVEVGSITWQLVEKACRDIVEAAQDEIFDETSDLTETNYYRGRYQAALDILELAGQYKTELKRQEH